MPKNFIPFTTGPFINGEEKYFEKLAESSIPQFQFSSKLDIPGFSKVDLDIITNYVIYNNPNIIWTMIWHGIPYPLARALLKQSIKATLGYLCKMKKKRNI
jgi:hypothetical protein